MLTNIGGRRNPVQPWHYDVHEHQIKVIATNAADTSEGLGTIWLRIVSTRSWRCLAARNTDDRTCDWLGRTYRMFDLASHGLEELDTDFRARWVVFDEQHARCSGAPERSRRLI